MRKVGDAECLENKYDDNDKLCYMNTLSLFQPLLDCQKIDSKTLTEYNTLIFRTALKNEY